MVGRRVTVLWNEPNGGQTWYVGSVLQSNPADFSLTIEYDFDGSTEIICVKDTIGEVRWLEGAPLPALSPGSASVSAAAAVRATLANPGQIVLLPAGGAFVGGRNSAYGPDVLHVGGLAALVVTPSRSNILHTRLTLLGIPGAEDLTVLLGSLLPNGAVELDQLRPVTAEDVRVALDDPASDLAVVTMRVAAAHAHIKSVRATLANPGQIVLLPAGGAFVGGRNSAYGPDVLHVGGLAALVVTPSRSNILHTRLTLLGIPGAEDLTVLLGSLLPNGAVELDQLRPVTAEDVRVALDDPASDLAVATLRVAAAHAHLKSVRAAALAAANVQQDARVARVEAPGPDDDLSVPALHRWRPCEQCTPSHVSVLGPDHAATGEFERGDPPSHAAQAEAPCGRC